MPRPNTDIGLAVAAGVINLWLFGWFFLLGLDGVWAIDGYYGGPQDPQAATYKSDALTTLWQVGAAVALPLAVFRCVRALCTHAVTLLLALAVISQLRTYGTG
ncbi:hypothetical protein [Streptomyces sp. NBC_01304]|uniref:hypothetical protein n=1 Tax=Streptomyces sp. NBC_01304 TaxID=2903818 RepID=UPI002E12EA50|nr:hypothetical protein OG430_25545 [Streptomyces sp. NBC_01304]